MITLGDLEQSGVAPLAQISAIQKKLSLGAVQVVRICIVLY